jgi:hypothetical protein
MKRTIGVLLLLAAPLLAACGPADSIRAADAAEKPPPTIEGVWQRAEIVRETGPQAGRHTVDVQPSLYVFGKTHYAITAVDGFTPRAYLGEPPTIEEEGRASVPFTGSSGTYTRSDDKLTLAPLAAKDPASMVGGKTSDYDVSWVGDDLWLTQADPDNGIVRTRFARTTEDQTKVTNEARRLQGVWRRAEMIVGSGPDAGAHVANMQPGYYIFTPTYFVANYVSSFAPRPFLSEAPTEAEYGGIFGAFVSFGGTYTVDDKDTLVLSPIVTKNPNNMRGRPFQSIKLEWAGNDVWFIYTGADGTQNRTRLTPVTD